MPLFFSIFAQGLRYSLYLIFCQTHQQGAILKFRKWLYLSLRTKIEKNKGTLLSQTFEVEGNKMPLVSSIIDQRLRYSLFLIFCHPHQQGNILEFRKWLYLSLWVKIKKTKGTLFSQTLKVEGNKVPFVFSIFDQGLRYGQSKNFEVFPFDVAYWIMSTLEAALPDWFGQKYLTRCLKYQNGMGLTWELINPRNFDFLCPPNREL